MDPARLVAELADLKEKLASLEGENTALKAERDRLTTALELLIPAPTDDEMREMEANIGKFEIVINEVASGSGGTADGR